MNRWLADNEDVSSTGVHTSRFPRRRVLVVDDDAGFTLLAGEALQQAAFEVKIAATVAEALEAFDQFSPDIVLLDIELPDGDGFELCRGIRGSAKNFDIPVVLVTGHNDMRSIEKAYEAGASDFMQKPVLWPTLPHRVDFMLRALQDRRALARSEQRNRALLEALPDASVLVDERGIIVEHLVGADTSDVRQLHGKPLEEAFPADISQVARRTLGGEAPTGTTHKFPTGAGATRRWFEARFRPQGKGGLLIVIRDCTERQRAETQIEYMAYYDPLTRLPNRQHLLARASHRFAADAERRETVALLYVDLDRFKRINDNLGRATGDALLKAVAQRLTHLLAPAGGGGGVGTPMARMAARVGGDEFVVLTEPLADETQAAMLAEEIQKVFNVPFDHAGHHLVVTPSIGVALYPSDTTEIEDLVVKAEMAMYLAKEQGRNGHAFFGQSMAMRSLKHLSIESDLRQALEKKEFKIAYQPKLDIRSGMITGVEALLRWPHPEKGMIPPDKFIPIAEDTGLIVPLGAWVLDEVCKQVQRWGQSGLGHLTAAVNVSPQQFMRSDFVDLVLQSVKSSGIPSQRLELEITEGLLMRNLAAARGTLDRLRATGITVAIDDFGTGYSSLGYLRSLPVSTLKIDRSFVKDLGEEEDAAAICAAILAMARELRLTVVAEGVENQEQLDFLQLHGCDLAQGYLIGKPMPALELERLLHRSAERSETLEAYMEGDLVEAPLDWAKSMGVK